MGGKARKKSQSKRAADLKRADDLKSIKIPVRDAAQREERRLRQQQGKALPREDKPGNAPDAPSKLEALMARCAPARTLLLAELDLYALARLAAVSKAARGAVADDEHARLRLDAERIFRAHPTDGCAWDWCGGDPHLHHRILCWPSKEHYDVSWAHSWSRRRLIESFGYDIWVRDADGREIVDFERLEEPVVRRAKPTDKYFDHEQEEIDRVNDYDDDYDLKDEEDYDGEDDFDDED